MITANDLSKHMKSREKLINLEKHIDDWLETKVFPIYSVTNNKFEVDGIFRSYLECFKDSLQERGFNVSIETERRYDGKCWVTLVIPPQEN